MELKINKYTTPAAIDFNFEELKAEVAEKMQYYHGLVYTDDQIQEAKADRAKLRKFVDALDAKRKEIKNELLAPYTEFEAKLNEIKKLVNGPISLIDSQVKDYEEQQRKSKEAACKSLYEDVMHPDELTIEKIWNDRWLLKSVSLKAVREEMEQAVERYDSELQIIERLPDYAYEAKQEYIRTLDMKAAIAYADKLAEDSRRKAEMEEARKMYEQEQAEIARKAEYINPPEDEEAAAYVPEPKQWISFRAELTVTQAKELRQFFIDRGITFKAI